MQNRVIIIETKQQLAHSLYSRLLEPSLIPSLPWQLLGFLASAGKWPQPSSWHHFDKDMGPTVSNISHCPRVKQSPSPTIIASESLHPFWLPLLQARLCSSCKHFYPEVGKCPPLGIASLLLDNEAMLTPFLGAYWNAVHSALLCALLFITAPSPLESGLRPIQVTLCWPWLPCSLLCGFYPWLSLGTSVLNSAPVSPLSD